VSSTDKQQEQQHEQQHEHHPHLARRARGLRRRRPLRRQLALQVSERHLERRQLQVRRSAQEKWYS